MLLYIYQEVPIYLFIYLFILRLFRNVLFWVEGQLMYTAKSKRDALAYLEPLGMAIKSFDTRGEEAKCRGRIRRINFVLRNSDTKRRGNTDNIQTYTKVHIYIMVKPIAYEKKKYIYIYICIPHPSPFLPTVVWVFTVPTPTKKGKRGCFFILKKRRKEEEKEEEEATGWLSAYDIILPLPKGQSGTGYLSSLPLPYTPSLCSTPMAPPTRNKKTTEKLNEPFVAFACCVIATPVGWFFPETKVNTYYAREAAMGNLILNIILSGVTLGCILVCWACAVDVYNSAFCKGLTGPNDPGYAWKSFTTIGGGFVLMIIATFLQLINTILAILLHLYLIFPFYILFLNSIYNLHLYIFQLVVQHLNSAVDVRQSERRGVFTPHWNHNTKKRTYDIAIYVFGLFFLFVCALRLLVSPFPHSNAFSGRHGAPPEHRRRLVLATAATVASGEGRAPAPRARVRHAAGTIESPRAPIPVPPFLCGLSFDFISLSLSLAFHWPLSSLLVFGGAQRIPARAISPALRLLPPPAHMSPLKGATGALIFTIIEFVAFACCVIATPVGWFFPETKVNTYYAREAAMGNLILNIILSGVTLGCILVCWACAVDVYNSAFCKGLTGPNDPGYAWKSFTTIGGGFVLMIIATFLQLINTILAILLPEVGRTCPSTASACAARGRNDRVPACTNPCAPFPLRPLFRLHLSLSLAFHWPLSSLLVFGGAQRIPARAISPALRLLPPPAHMSPLKGATGALIFTIIEFVAFACCVIATPVGWFFPESKVNTYYAREAAMGNLILNIILSGVTLGCILVCWACAVDVYNSAFCKGLTGPNDPGYAWKSFTTIGGGFVLMIIATFLQLINTILAILLPESGEGRAPAPRARVRHAAGTIESPRAPIPVPPFLCGLSFDFISLSLAFHWPLSSLLVFGGAQRIPARAISPALRLLPPPAHMSPLKGATGALIFTIIEFVAFACCVIATPVGWFFPENKVNTYYAREAAMGNLILNIILSGVTLGCILVCWACAVDVYNSAFCKGLTGPNDPGYAWKSFTTIGGGFVLMIIATFLQLINTILAILLHARAGKLIQHSLSTQQRIFRTPRRSPEHRRRLVLATTATVASREWGRTCPSTASACAARGRNDRVPACTNPCAPFPLRPLFRLHLSLSLSLAFHWPLSSLLVFGGAQRIPARAISPALRLLPPPAHMSPLKGATGALIFTIIEFVAFACCVIATPVGWFFPETKVNTYYAREAAMGNLILNIILSGVTLGCILVCWACAVDVYNSAFCKGLTGPNDPGYAWKSFTTIGGGFVLMIIATFLQLINTILAILLGGEINPAFPFHTATHFPDATALPGAQAATGVSHHRDGGIPRWGRTCPSTASACAARGRNDRVPACTNPCAPFPLRPLFRLHLSLSLSSIGPCLPFLFSVALNVSLPGLSLPLSAFSAPAHMSPLKGATGALIFTIIEFVAFACCVIATPVGWFFPETKVNTYYAREAAMGNLILNIILSGVTLGCILVCWACAVDVYNSAFCKGLTGPNDPGYAWKSFTTIGGGFVLMIIATFLQLINTILAILLIVISLYIFLVCSFSLCELYAYWLAPFHTATHFPDATALPEHRRRLVLATTATVASREWGRTCPSTASACAARGRNDRVPACTNPCAPFPLRPLFRLHLSLSLSLAFHWPLSSLLVFGGAQRIPARAISPALRLLPPPAHMSPLKGATGALIFTIIEFVAFACCVIATPVGWFFPETKVNTYYAREAAMGNLRRHPRLHPGMLGVRRGRVQPAFCKGLTGPNDPGYAWKSFTTIGGGFVLMIIATFLQLINTILAILLPESGKDVPQHRERVCGTRPERSSPRVHQSLCPLSSAASLSTSSLSLSLSRLPLAPVFPSCFRWRSTYPCQGYLSRSPPSPAPCTHFVAFACCVIATPVGWFFPETKVNTYYAREAAMGNLILNIILSGVTLGCILGLTGPNDPGYAWKSFTTIGGGFVLMIIATFLQLINTILAILLIIISLYIFWFVLSLCVSFTLIVPRVGRTCPSTASACAARGRNDRVPACTNPCAPFLCGLFRLHLSLSLAFHWPLSSLLVFGGAQRIPARAISPALRLLPPPAHMSPLKGATGALIFTIIEFVAFACCVIATPVGWFFPETKVNTYYAREAAMGNLILNIILSGVTLGCILGLTGPNDPGYAWKSFTTIGGGFVLMIIATFLQLINTILAILLGGEINPAFPFPHSNAFSGRHGAPSEHRRRLVLATTATVASREWGRTCPSTASACAARGRNDRVPACTNPCAPFPLRPLSTSSLSLSLAFHWPLSSLLVFGGAQRIPARAISPALRLLPPPAHMSPLKGATGALIFTIIEFVAFACCVIATPVGWFFPESKVNTYYAREAAMGNLILNIILSGVTLGCILVCWACAVDVYNSAFCKGLTGPNDPGYAWKSFTTIGGGFVLMIIATFLQLINTILAILLIIISLYIFWFVLSLCVSFTLIATTATVASGEGRAPAPRARVRHAAGTIESPRAPIPVPPFLCGLSFDFISLSLSPSIGPCLPFLFSVALNVSLPGLSLRLRLLPPPAHMSPLKGATGALIFTIIEFVAFACCVIATPIGWFFPESKVNTYYAREAAMGNLILNIILSGVTLGCILVCWACAVDVYNSAFCKGLTGPNDPGYAWKSFTTIGGGFVLMIIATFLQLINTILAILLRAPAPYRRPSHARAGKLIQHCNIAIYFLPLSTLRRIFRTPRRSPGAQAATGVSHHRDGGSRSMYTNRLHGDTCSLLIYSPWPHIHFTGLSPESKDVPQHRERVCGTRPERSSPRVHQSLCPLSSAASLSTSSLSLSLSRLPLAPVFPSFFGGARRIPARAISPALRLPPAPAHMSPLKGATGALIFTIIEFVTFACCVIATPIGWFFPENKVNTYYAREAAMGNLILNIILSGVTLGCILVCWACAVDVYNSAFCKGLTGPNDPGYAWKSFTTIGGGFVLMIIATFLQLINTILAILLGGEINPAFPFPHSNAFSGRHGAPPEHRRRLVLATAATVASREWGRTCPSTASACAARGRNDRVPACTNPCAPFPLRPLFRLHLSLSLAFHWPLSSLLVFGGAQRIPARAISPALRLLPPPAHMSPLKGATGALIFTIIEFVAFACCVIATPVGWFFPETKVNTYYAREAAMGNLILNIILSGVTLGCILVCWACAVDVYNSAFCKGLTGPNDPGYAWKSFTTIGGGFVLMIIATFLQLINTILAILLHHRDGGSRSMYTNRLHGDTVGKDVPQHRERVCGTRPERSSPRVHQSLCPLSSAASLSTSSLSLAFHWPLSSLLFSVALDVSLPWLSLPLSAFPRPLHTCPRSRWLNELQMCRVGWIATKKTTIGVVIVFSLFTFFNTLFSYFVFVAREVGQFVLWRIVMLMEEEIGGGRLELCPSRLVFLKPAQGKCPPTATLSAPRRKATARAELLSLSYYTLQK
eukprot:gene1192-708_t